LVAVAAEPDHEQRRVIRRTIVTRRVTRGAPELVIVTGLLGTPRTIRSMRKGHARDLGEGAPLLYHHLARHVPGPGQGRRIPRLFSGERLSECAADGPELMRDPHHAMKSPASASTGKRQGQTRRGIHNRLPASGFLLPPEPTDILLVSSLLIFMSSLPDGAPHGSLGR
jgi:hypothetical protein